MLKVPLAILLLLITVLVGKPVSWIIGAGIAASRRTFGPGGPGLASRVRQFLEVEAPMYSIYLLLSGSGEWDGNLTS